MRTEPYGIGYALMSIGRRDEYADQKRHKPRNLWMPRSKAHRRGKVTMRNHGASKPKRSTARSKR